MSHLPTRREAVVAGSLGYFLTGPALSVARAHGALAKLRVAGVGVGTPDPKARKGGKGSSDIEQAAAAGMDVAALCDIDGDRLQRRAETWPSAKQFADYREMFDSAADTFDAVVISTPDHHHAPAAVRAMKKGKHVYVQKPLTHTPHEARVLRELAAKTGVVTQMGNQGSGLSGLRRAVELIRGGALGTVTEAHVWTNRPARFWKQSPDIVARPAEMPEVPKHVRWDLFVGPAPERAYHPAYHPHDWRGYWDFGTGALGDMACHTANMAFRALKLDAPTAVKAEAAETNAETYPAWAKIAYTYPTCVLHWYEGANAGTRVLPPAELLAKVLKPGEKLSDSGCILVGDKGILFSPNDYAAEFRLLPEASFVGVQTAKPEAGPPGVPDKQQDLFMKKEWMVAIEAGKPAEASSNFDIAGRLTEAMLLGNIAVRFAGQSLTWDAATMKFPQSAAATKLVSKEYRTGWGV